MLFHNCVAQTRNLKKTSRHFSVKYYYGYGDLESSLHYNIDSLSHFCIKYNLKKVGYNFLSLFWPPNLFLFPSSFLFILSFLLFLFPFWLFSLYFLFLFFFFLFDFSLYTFWLPSSSFHAMYLYLHTMILLSGGSGD